jgi:hypothetical protein
LVRRFTAQVDLGAFVVGGREEVAGACALVVGVAGNNEVLGGFPPPPPLVDASAMTTTATIPRTAIVATMDSHIPRLSSSTRPVAAASSSESSPTGAPQWGQKLAPGVSGWLHTRQRRVALTIADEVFQMPGTEFSGPPPAVCLGGS